MSDRLPHEKGFHVSWDQIHRDSRALAWRLDGQGPDNGAWKAVVAITRGGMAPAMILSRELDIRTVDTISVEVVRSIMPKAHFATVYAKPKGRPQVDTFITEVSQDTWIFFPWDMALQYVEPYRGA